MKEIEELIDDIIKYKDADVDWYKTAIISKFRELKQQVERLTECRDHWKLSYEELKKKTGTVQERIKEPIPANEDDYGEDFIQPPRYEDDEI